MHAQLTDCMHSMQSTPRTSRRLFSSAAKTLAACARSSGPDSSRPAAVAPPPLTPRRCPRRRPARGQQPAAAAGQLPLPAPPRWPLRPSPGAAAGLAAGAPRPPGWLGWPPAGWLPAPQHAAQWPAYPWCQGGSIDSSRGALPLGCKTPLLCARLKNGMRGQMRSGHVRSNHLLCCAREAGRRLEEM